MERKYSAQELMCFQVILSSRKTIPCIEYWVACWQSTTCLSQNRTWMGREKINDQEEREMFCYRHIIRLWVWLQDTKYHRNRLIYLLLQWCFRGLIIKLVWRPNDTNSSVKASESWEGTCGVLQHFQEFLLWFWSPQLLFLNCQKLNL